MANQKVSDMQKVYTVKPEDLMYVVQDGVSSNITVADVFSKLPDVLLSGSFQLDTVESVVANGGVISDNHVVTALTVDNIDREFTISQSTPEVPLANFMVKILYLKTTFSGSAIITGGFIPGIESIVLSNRGDAAILMSTPNGWIYLAGSAQVNRL